MHTLDSRSFLTNKQSRHPFVSNFTSSLINIRPNPAYLMVGIYTSTICLDLADKGYKTWCKTIQGILSSSPYRVPNKLAWCYLYKRPMTMTQWGSSRSVGFSHQQLIPFHKLLLWALTYVVRPIYVSPRPYFILSSQLFTCSPISSFTSGNALS